MTRGEILAERISLLASRLVDREVPELQIIENNNAVKGIAIGGHNILQRHERRLQTLRDLLAERVRLENEYPLAPEDEETWYHDLVSAIFAIIDHQAARLYQALEADSQRLVGGSSEPFIEQVREQMNRLRLQYIREADITEGEREHRKKIVPAGGPPSITLNISGSQIAGLNAGGVVGTIQANLTSLQTAGEVKIADALKALAESIPADSSLSNDAKRDALECVSGMGEELARPREQRRPAILRAMGQGLVGLIRHTDKVYAAYEILKNAARASGYDLP